jgi:hypothetical protein
MEVATEVKVCVYTTVALSGDRDDLGVVMGVITIIDGMSIAIIDGLQWAGCATTAA